MKSFFESLLVFSIMTGLLLPARILFVEYVSDDWLGSLGIISVISVSIILLAKKKKLGFFGSMFERQMYKFQHGKRGLLVFGESVFLLFILGGMIFAIEQGNSVYSELQLAPINKISSSTPEEILTLTNDWNANDWLIGFLMGPVALLTSFPEMSAAIASIDQKLDGWLLHFYTVGFIEYVELLGVLIYYKISFRKNSTLISSLYTKTPIQNYNSC